MRLASESERIHAAGGEVIAISTDEDARQAGMFARWPTPHVMYVSDPGGARWLRPLGLFDPDERGGIALPAILVVDPDGGAAYRYVGRDFADRTTDHEAITALEALGLDPIAPPAGGPAGTVPTDLDRFFRPEHLVPYFKGNKFAATAIGGRTDDPELRSIAREHRRMSDATLTAWETLTSTHD